MLRKDETLKFRTVKPDSPETPELIALYESAFPQNARRDLGPLIANITGRSEVLSLWLDGEFCGFMVVLSYRDIAHMIYFAIGERYRGRGIGTGALNLLRETKPTYRIIADLEAEYEGAANNGQRRLRREFYLRNGYRVSPVHYDWQGDPYDILISGGSISREEFWEFWESFD